jgi:hypothetical protein
MKWGWSEAVLEMRGYPLLGKVNVSHVCLVRAKSLKLLSVARSASALKAHLIPRYCIPLLWFCTNIFTCTNTKVRQPFDKGGLRAVTHALFGRGALDARQSL